jgi:hypothetical protein
MSKLANLAKSINDTAKSMDIYHQSWSYWKALCVDLIGPYTLKGKNGSSIYFMCLTMINPATSWFKIVELPTVAQETTVPPVGKGKTLR